MQLKSQVAGDNAYITSLRGVKSEASQVWTGGNFLPNSPLLYPNKAPKLLLKVE
jgi:hypothetical protein